MSKFGPFALSTRERSRLAWRAMVDAAARAFWWECQHWTSWTGFHRVSVDLDAALAAPRPWRSQRKPDPRRRYSRRHRRGCKWCRFAGRRSEFSSVRRNPHWKVVTR